MDTNQIDSHESSPVGLAPISPSLSIKKRGKISSMSKKKGPVGPPETYYVI